MFFRRRMLTNQRLVDSRINHCRMSLVISSVEASMSATFNLVAIPSALLCTSRDSSSHNIDLFSSLGNFQLHGVHAEKRNVRRRTRTYFFEMFRWKMQTCPSRHFQVLAKNPNKSSVNESDAQITTIKAILYILLYTVDVIKSNIPASKILIPMEEDG